MDGDRIHNNCIVAQSGGPTTAINASLAGVIKGVCEAEGYDRIYGALNGIKGVIDDRFLNLSEQKERIPDFLETLFRTPAMYLGSCRYKLPDYKEDEEPYQVIFKRFETMHIGAFFYIGGNDSMDTVVKLNQYATHIGSSVRVIGIPKTIDNDLCLTDHTPGYGSAAKYVATTLLEIAHDTFIYAVKSVTIVEIMGRDAGWLTGAAALARTAYSNAPHLIYLPEVEFDIAECISDVETLLETRNNVIIAISEGIHDKHGEYISSAEAVADTFGHMQLSGAGKSLEYQIKEALDVKVRSVELNVSQRCAAHVAAKTDLDESFRLGFQGVCAAAKGSSGVMMGLRRLDGEAYDTEVIEIPAADIANAVKSVPREWINARGNDVTKEFTDYVYPLIQGEVEQSFRDGVPCYLPVDHLM